VKSRFLSPLFFTFRSRCTEYDSLSTFAPPSYIACPSSTCLAAEADCKQLISAFCFTDTARGAPSTCPPYLLMPVAYSTPARRSPHLPRLQWHWYSRKMLEFSHLVKILAYGRCRDTEWRATAVAGSRRARQLSQQTQTAVQPLCGAPTIKSA
jgi:hypothetical protein